MQAVVVVFFSTYGCGKQHIAFALPDLKQNTSFHVNKNKINNNPTALAAHIQLYFGPWFP